MDERGEVGRRPAAEEREPLLSPVRAFLMLAAVAVVVPLTILATRPEAAPTTPGAARGPDFSLTDEEAIAEFERLHGLQLAAYENRDVSIVPRVYTPDSPVAPRVVKEITKLLRQDVTTTTDFETRDVLVLRSGPSEVVLKQTAVVDAKFFNDDGDEISLNAPAELQEIEWTLRRLSDTWLIHDAVITSSHPTRSETS